MRYQSIIAMFLVSGWLIAGCDDSFKQGKREAQEFVCGEDDQTYTLQEAASAHVAVKHRGTCDEPMECEEDSDCFVGDYCQIIYCADDEGSITEPCPAGYCVPDPYACACPDVYAPVCGTDGWTYGNECEALCSGVMVAHEGTCEPDPGGECVRAGCSGELCIDSELEDDLLTTCEWRPEYACYQDATCERQPNGQCWFTPTHELVECLQNVGGGCACPEYYAPVCGSDGNTYDNECFAGCAGAMVVHDGECNGCNCPGVFEPVCASDGQTYINSCEAECAGQWVVSEGACESTYCESDYDCALGQYCELYYEVTDEYETRTKLKSSIMSDDEPYVSGVCRDWCDLIDCAPGYTCEQGSCVPNGFEDCRTTGCYYDEDECSPCWGTWECLPAGAVC